MTSYIKCDILFTWMVSEMIAELSKRMSLFLCKKEIVEQEMAEVYQLYLIHISMCIRDRV